MDHQMESDKRKHDKAVIDGGDQQESLDSEVKNRRPEANVTPQTSITYRYFSKEFIKAQAYEIRINYINARRTGFYIPPRYPTEELQIDLDRCPKRRNGPCWNTKKITNTKKQKSDMKTTSSSKPASLKGRKAKRASEGIERKTKETSLLMVQLEDYEAKPVSPDVIKANMGETLSSQVAASILNRWKAAPISGVINLKMTETCSTKMAEWKTWKANLASEAFKEGGNFKEGELPSNVLPEKIVPPEKNDHRPYEISLPDYIRPQVPEIKPAAPIGFYIEKSEADLIVKQEMELPPRPKRPPRRKSPKPMDPRKLPKRKIVEKKREKVSPKFIQWQAWRTQLATDVIKVHGNQKGIKEGQLPSSLSPQRIEIPENHVRRAHEVFNKDYIKARVAQLRASMAASTSINRNVWGR